MKTFIRVIQAYLTITIFIICQSCKSPTAPKNDNQPDTTSHSFSWTRYEFGEYLSGYSSNIYDVGIINENDIWAVGEIHYRDTLNPANDIHYNAIHWNGVKWELKTIYYRDNNNFEYYNPIRAISVIDSKNIWFSNFTHSDGTYFTSIQLNIPFPATVNKIWGKSSNDLYIVGTGGNIAHYDGKAWKKIESGTTLDLVDIYSQDGKDIYIAGGNLQSDEGILLKGNVNGFETIAEGKRSVERNDLFNPYFNGAVGTVWVSPSNTLYFAGGLFYKMKQGQKMELISSFEGNDYGLNVHGEYFGFLSKVRGNSDNDMVIVGEGNTIRHYNGVSWKQLGMPYDYSSRDTWLNVAMKDNIIAVVGRSDRIGIAMILKRVNK